MQFTKKKYNIQFQWETRIQKTCTSPHNDKPNTHSDKSKNNFILTYNPLFWNRNYIILPPPYIKDKQVI